MILLWGETPINHGGKYSLLWNRESEPAPLEGQYKLAKSEGGLAFAYALNEWK
jgi:hypothetical protein